MRWGEGLGARAQAGVPVLRRERLLAGGEGGVGDGGGEGAAGDDGAGRLSEGGAVGGAGAAVNGGFCLDHEDDFGGGRSGDGVRGSGGVERSVHGIAGRNGEHIVGAGGVVWAGWTGGSGDLGCGASEGRNGDLNERSAF